MAHTLNEINFRLRTLLGEADFTGLGIPMAGDENKPDDSPIAGDVLLTAANAWRKYIRRGDDFLEQIQKVVDAASTANKSKEEIEKRRAISDVRSTVVKAQGLLASAYGDFKEGREQMYQVAKIWKIGTKRSNPGYPSKQLGLLKEGVLTSEMEKGSAGIMSASGKMLDLGAKSSGMLRAAARVASPMGGAPAGAEGIIGTCLDFRDKVSEACFARVNGVMRRAVELSNRAWEAMKYEATIGPADKTEWNCPWEDDPEFGGREVV